MKCNIRFKRLATYSMLLIWWTLMLVALGVFIFISTVISGDSKSNPQTREEIRSEYHGKEGGLGDFWSVQCIEGNCKPKPQNRRR